jgi:peptide-methionine (S)-S-oxide reductase
MDFQKRFPGSIESSSVGFMSPDPNAIKNPSYRQVCSGTTSHVEVLQVELKNPDAHFEELIKFFFMFHGTSIHRGGGSACIVSIICTLIRMLLITSFSPDLFVCVCAQNLHDENVDPTTKDRQGNDAGTQYASWIFCTDEEQLRIAHKVKEELQTLITAGKVKGYNQKTVSTNIGPANEYYPAHEEHQEYLMKNPLGYCNHRFRFKEWPSLN